MLVSSQIVCTHIPLTISTERETGVLPLGCFGKIRGSELLRSSGHQPANKFDAHKRAEPRELKGEMEPTSSLANRIALFSYCLSQTELGFPLLAAKNILTDSGRQPKTRYFTR